MSPLFGKKPEGKTILVLDVEQGSVGAGLLYLKQGDMPHLFGQTRRQIPLLHTRQSSEIARSIQRSLHDIVAEQSLFATRLRNQARSSALGTVEAVAVFMGAPWGVPNLQKGSPDFVESMRDFIAGEIPAFIGEVPATFHTSAEGGTFSANRLRSTDSALLVLVRAEVTELVYLLEARVAGYATIPQGEHFLARTLRAHAGLTSAEARSTLYLSHDHSPLREPLSAAIKQYASSMAQVLPALVGTNAAPNLIVLAEEHAGEQFARGFAHSDELAELFPHGGSVELLRPHHFASHIGHQTPADLFLLADALFVDKKFNSIY